MTASRAVSPAGFRGLVTVFAFVAFALQSYVAQTHIHMPPEIRSGITANEDAPAAPQSASAEKREHDRRPPSDDPDHCPICQEILYSGSYVVPFLPALAPPTAITAPAACLVFVRVIVKATAHSWFGRGPPRP